MPAPKLFFIAALLLIIGATQDAKACKDALYDCKTSNECCPGLSCQPGVGVNVCVHSPRRVDEPCDAASGTPSSCDAGMSCHPDIQRCYNVPRQVEQPCDTNIPCAEDLACDLNTKRCVAPSEWGEGCHASRPCAGGLSCHSGDSKCYSSPRLQDEPCSSTRAGEKCSDELICDDKATQACVPRGLLGWKCHAGRPCEAGFSCHTNGICYMVPRQPGNPCSANAPCGDPYVCDLAVTRKCVVPASWGEQCWDGRPCWDGLSCHQNRICYTAPRSEGEPCNQVHTCTPGLFCDINATATCVAPAGYGMRCWASKPCQAGLSCHSRLRFCYNNPRLEGEPCGREPDNACAEGLVCDLNATMTCVPRAGYLDICYVNRPCAANMSCHSTDRICYNQPRLLGEPCSARPGEGCAEGTVCDTAYRICLAKGQWGEPCWASRPCADGLSCHPRLNKCFNAPRQYDEPCTTGAANSCAAPMVCVPGLNYCSHKARWREPCYTGMPCDEEQRLSCQATHAQCYNNPRNIFEPCNSASAECDTTWLFPCMGNSPYSYCEPNGGGLESAALALPKGSALSQRLAANATKAAERATASEAAFSAKLVAVAVKANAPGLTPAGRAARKAAKAARRAIKEDKAKARAHKAALNPSNCVSTAKAKSP